MSPDEAATWTPLSVALALSIVHMTVELARDGEATTEQLDAALRYIEGVSDAAWCQA